jgi:hypothetical protein
MYLFILIITLRNYCNHCNDRKKDTFKKTVISSLVYFSLRLLPGIRYIDMASGPLFVSLAENGLPKAEKQ